MKKITLFLVLFLGWAHIYGQLGRIMDEYFGIENSELPLNNTVQHRSPDIVLQGLDSMQVRDVLFGRVLKEYKFSYDDRGNTTLVIDLNYSLTSGQPTDGSKKERMYDGQDRLTEMISYIYNNGWEPTDHAWYFYASGDDVDSIYVEAYSNGAWEPARYHLYTYNAAGLVSEIITYAYDGSSWNLDERLQITYNAAGKPLEEIYQIYTNNTWENDLKRTHAYDNANRDTLRIVYTWDNNQWENAFKTETTYNSFDYVQQQIEYEYENGQWEYVTKIENTHDNIGVLTRTQFYTYDDNSSSWESTLRLDYTHDYNTTRDQLLLPYEGAAGINTNGLFRRKPVSGSVYQGSNSQHVGDMTFYYSDHALGMENLQNPFAVYPNPTSDYLYITGKNATPEKIEIYSITGNVLGTYQNTERIDVSRLQTGIYLLKLHTPKGSWSLKFQKL